MNEQAIGHWAYEWLLSIGFDADISSKLTLVINVLILIIISLLVDLIARRVILRLVTIYVKRSRNTYDDIFLEKNVFQSLAHVIPAGFIHYSVPFLFEEIEVISLVQKLISVYIILVLMNVASKFFKAVEHIGLNSPSMEGKPVSSFVQVMKIVVSILGIILIISLVIGKSPITILTAFGAATAIILLIFRDTILGFVASIQISTNDMVRVGDWVSMDKYGADGDVLEINLTTVKIKNFDKTITTVPTYAFISDSFKNWRGMENTGVRRIKRSLYIDLNSVTFVSDSMLSDFQSYALIKDFVNNRQEEIEAWNKQHYPEDSVPINGRHMTNLGVFRHYALNYLKSNPKIDQAQTVMVRQLQPTELGIPLEVYCFSNDIAWVNYENIQADIFDHLIAAANMFGVSVFQNPSGRDFSSIARPTN